MQQQVQDSPLLTVKQFCERYPFISQGGLRWKIFNCQENGFQDAFSWIGKRVYVKPEAFFRIVEDQNGRRN
ncbi:DNA-binding protein [bacterium]|nr:DNA-binding protein [bacterium]